MRPPDVAVRQGLPLVRTPLFGRSREIAEITALLAGGGLVTITGQGGIGKTRVAIEVARTQPRRLIFVSLADVDRSGVAGAILRAAAGGGAMAPLAPLAPGAKTVAGIWAGLADEVAGAPLLLVLDTFEHLTGAAEMVNDIRSSIPDLAILVTSRCRLGLRDEAVVPMLGLQVDAGGPAADMFAERSRRVGGDRHANDEAEQLAALEICRLLGGVPLAIELAASRTALMMPSALLAQFRLTDRGRVLGLLSRGPVDLPSRQLSMRATLSWSYQLLSSSEQTLFRRLAVFPGSFTLDAVEQVCGGVGSTDKWSPPDASLNGISQLVDLRLVEPLTPTAGRAAVDARFELHGAPRAFAVELLEMSGEAEPISARLHDWCLDFATRADRGLASTDEQSWLDRIEDELPVLRKTLTAFANAGEPVRGITLAAGIAGFWAVRGPLAEANQWLQTFLEIDRVGGGLTSQLRAIAVAWANRLGLQTDGRVNIGDVRSARATVVGQPCSPALWLRSTDQLIYGLVALGEVTESLTMIEDGLRLARATRDSYWTSLYLYRRASVAYMTMATDPANSASACAEEAVAVATDHGHRRIAAQSQALVAFCRLADGDISGARDSMLSALQNLQASGDRTSAIDAMNTLGVILPQLAEPTQAAQSLRDAMLLARRVGYGHGEIFSAWVTAYLCCRIGRLLDAVALDDALAAYLNTIQSWLPRDVYAHYRVAIDAARSTVQPSRTLGRGWGWLRARAMQIASELSVAGAAEAADQGAASGTVFETAGPAFAALPAHPTAIAVAVAGGIAAATNRPGRAGAGPGPVAGVTVLAQQAAPTAESADLTAPPRERLRTARSAHRHDLTARELQILAAIASGQTNAQIAGELFLSAKTVMHHSTSIYRKLAVGGRAEAVALAYRTGLLSNPSG
ncbi:MAG: LuxR C-terminal-related transcriptional regulator [Nakamurella sp.]